MSEKLPYLHGRLVVECMPRQMTALCLTSDRHALGNEEAEKKEKEKWLLKRRPISSPDLVVPCG
jgi:hypothetical protein